MNSAEIERFMVQVQDTTLFQIEWPELLSAAPRAISKMGGSLVAVTPTIRTLSLVGSTPSAYDLQYVALLPLCPQRLTFLQI